MLLSPCLAKLSNIIYDVAMNKITESEQNSLFPIWLIRSKVHPTRQRVDMLERPLLLQKLDEHLEATLSLIHAPAGYGKSTLLANWRKNLLKNNYKVCWLSLEKEDNELFQLLTYIAFSLSEGGIDFKAGGVTDDSLFKDLSPRNFLSVINHVIESQKEKVILILDDFENMDDEAIRTVIKPLLDYAPSNLHIAIASRDDSKLKITNLETQGLVKRILAENLRFSQEELRTFFPESLPTKTIQHIYTLTEGWPVTIQMFRNSIGVERDIDHILSNFKGSSGMITTYLSEQIFQNLDTELQDFLMDISLLDRISFSFVNFLRGKEDSATWFNASKSLNTLVLPVEQVEDTYRLHPLFREYLYERLTTVKPERTNELHLRTAEWFADHDNIVTATRHCIKANQPQRAVEIIEKAGGIIIWLREGLTRLRAIFKLLDGKIILNSPRMISISCLIDIKDGKVYQARSKYDEMLRNYGKSKKNLNPSEQEQINHETMLLESLLACYEGKMLSKAFCDKLNQKIPRIDPEEHTTLGHHYTLLCLAYTQLGMFELALEYAEKSISEFRYFSSVYGEVYINFHLGNIYFAQGKSLKAEDYYQTGLNLARKHFNDDKGMKLVAYILIAELKYELNQINSLPNIIETIPKQLEEREAWFDIYAAGYATASNIEFNKYGIDAAITVIDCATNYAAEQKLTRLNNLLVFQRIDLHLRAGQDKKAKEVLMQSKIDLKNYKNPDNNDIAWRESDTAVHAITRLQIKEKKFDKALSELAHFAEHAKNYGHVKSCIRYEILQSLAYQGKNDASLANLHLSHALELSRKSGFIRSFIDEGNELKKVLKQYVNESTQASPENIEQAKNILPHFEETDNLSDPKQLLSKREHEVLQQLVRGFSNKVIAKNIEVSENTVRFHLKNIFAKLHVDNRLQAVYTAQKRNII